MENQKKIKRIRLFHYNFVLLIFGQLFSLLGNTILKFSLSMYVLEVTGSATIFSVLLAVAMIPTVLLSPVGGVFADRLHRKKMMVSLDALSGCFVMVVSIVFLWNVNLFLIGILLILLSILGAFETPTVQACIPQMQSTDENIARANAVVNQINSIAALAAPFLGNALYLTLGLVPVLFMSVGTFFLAAIIECFIRLDYYPRKFTDKFFFVLKNDFKDSVRFIFRENKPIAKLLILSAVSAFFLIGIATVGLPYLVRTVLSMSSTHYAISESVIGFSAILGSIIGGVIATKLQGKHLYLFIFLVGLSLFPVGIAFVFLENTLTLYIILTVSLCIAQMVACIFSIHVLSAIQRQTPDDLIGKIMAYCISLSTFAQPLGQVVYGALFDAFSNEVYYVFIPSGICICIIGLLSIRTFRKLYNKEHQS